MIWVLILLPICVYFMWSDLRDGLRSYDKGHYGLAALWFIGAAWFAFLTGYYGWTLHRELKSDTPAEVCKTPEAPSP